MAKVTSVKHTIAIIGMGHIGSALRSGLVKSGVKHSRIVTSKSSRTNAHAVRAAHWIFLAVKPGMVATVLRELKGELKGKVVISLAAGIEKTKLKKLANKVRVGRIMPNIPIAEGEGVVGVLYGSLTLTEKKTLRRMLSGLGLLIEARDDRELEALTLISGCGPGIVAYLIEMLAQNARRAGFRGSKSEAVALQTFKGTLSYIGAKKITAKNLMKAVATKGGVTETILTDLSRNGFNKNFAHAIKAGHAKIKKLRK